MVNTNDTTYMCICPSCGEITNYLRDDVCTGCRAPVDNIINTGLFAKEYYELS